MGTSVLYVDGDTARQSRTVTRLGRGGLDVTGADSVEAATEAFEGGNFDCVVTERALPDGTGFDLIRTVREADPTVVNLLYTDDTRDRSADDAADILAERIDRSQPAALARLRMRIRSAVDTHRYRGFPVPDDEGTRLNVIRSLDLEQLSEDASLDVMAQTISQEFDTAASFVGVVNDEEEQFLAIDGLDWESLPREDTICTHALLTDDVTVIEDIDEDPRFADIDVLREAGIRSYAGARIDVESCGVGMVCVLDSDTREFSTSDRIRLRQYARQAAAALKRRTRETQIDN